MISASNRLLGALALGLVSHLALAPSTSAAILVPQMSEADYLVQIFHSAFTAVDETGSLPQDRLEHFESIMGSEQAEVDLLYSKSGGMFTLTQWISATAPPGSLGVTARTFFSIGFDIVPEPGESVGDPITVYLQMGTTPITEIGVASVTLYGSQRGPGGLSLNGPGTLVIPATIGGTTGLDLSILGGAGGGRLSGFLQGAVSLSVSLDSEIDNTPSQLPPTIPNSTIPEPASFLVWLGVGVAFVAGQSIRQMRARYD